jgi:predicted Rossmann-fold nucleotide-binding protein
LLTLRQTGKVTKQLPIVLYGKAYWDKVLNLQAMVDYGTIAKADMDMFFTTDSVDEAYDFVTKGLRKTWG